MNLILKLKENYQIAILVLFVLLFFKQCSINRDIDRIQKESIKQSEKVDSIQRSLNSLRFIERNEVRDEMNNVMFNFLIYEDDLDKGKLSLSDIRNKISVDE